MNNQDYLKIPPTAFRNALEKLDALNIPRPVFSAWHDQAGYELSLLRQSDLPYIGGKDPYWQYRQTQTFQGRTFHLQWDVEPLQEDCYYCLLQFSCYEKQPKIGNGDDQSDSSD